MFPNRTLQSHLGPLVLGSTLLMSMVACGHKPEASETSLVPTVVVNPVIQKTVPVYGEFVCRTDASSVDLVARVEGILLEKSFQEGTLVRKNQVLYRIDPAKYEANVLSTKAKVAQAQAQLNKARQDVERFKPLAASHAIPQQELDTALANQLVCEADVQAAKAALTQAELDLSYCTIRAPMSGMVGKSLVNTGSLVGRGSATVLDTISEMNPIQVNFGVPESGYLAVRKRNGKGVSREIELVLADNTVYPHKGQLKMLDRAVDLKTGTLEVQGEFPNPEGLIRPNQFGRVRMVVDTAENALLIPQKAVIEQQGAKAVYVVGADNKVAQRTVSLGSSFENFFIVKEGLQAGDRVIVEGQQKARPGSPVNPSDKPATTEGGK